MDKPVHVPGSYFLMRSRTHMTPEFLIFRQQRHEISEASGVIRFDDEAIDARSNQLIPGSAGVGNHNWPPGRLGLYDDIAHLFYRTWQDQRERSRKHLAYLFNLQRASEEHTLREA